MFYLMSRTNNKLNFKKVQIYWKFGSKNALLIWFLLLKHKLFSQIISFALPSSSSPPWPKANKMKTHITDHNDWTCMACADTAPGSTTNRPIACDTSSIKVSICTMSERQWIQANFQFHACTQFTINELCNVKSTGHFKTKYWIKTFHFDPFYCSSSMCSTTSSSTSSSSYDHWTKHKRGLLPL